jgi:Lon protease-like protein
MESGTREFGMCIRDREKAFADIGTMLEIRDIQYFPDGRSVVYAIGGR